MPTIALVDDDENILASLKIFFEAEGYQVRTYHDGATALTALAEMNWPGNVRQLRNLVHRLAVFAEHDPITREDVELHRTAAGLDGQLRSAAPRSGSLTVGDDLVRGLSAQHSRRENEQILARNQIRVLEAEGQDVDAICRIMGIARATFFRIKGG